MVYKHVKWVIPGCVGEESATQSEGQRAQTQMCLVFGGIPNYCV